MGLICAAAFTLTNCTKELESQSPVKEGVPFEITASTGSTKTTNDGLNTVWAPDDALSVFHAVAEGDTYVTDGQFTFTSENSFTGTLAEALGASQSYDWYAFYPYSKYNKTPAGTSSENFGFTTIGGTSQTQNGSNMSHIAGKACPMYGIATGVSASTTPNILMNHLTSVVKIHLTNNSGTNMTVNSISFTAPEDIVGTYYINFASSPVVYTKRDAAYVSNTATLSVDGGGVISDGSSADFYIAIKPFTAAKGSKLSLSVNGSEKEITLDSDVTFTAGKIKTLNYTVSEIIDYVTLPWKEDFSGDLGKYTLVSTTSDTKTYNEATAGGKAPELLVAKNNGSFSAKVKATAGTYELTFKSNNSQYLSIAIDEAAITLLEVSDSEYSLTIPDGVEYFNISFTNTNNSKNVRLDDILLASATRPRLATPVVTASLNSEANNSIDVSWDKVDDAGSYVVTATPTSGTEVSMTVNAPATSYTLTDLEYETEYSISVVAKPSDEASYRDSEEGVANKKVTTGISTSPETDVVFDYASLYSDVTSGSKEVTTNTVGDVTMTYTKVSGSNAPKYYANGTNLRIYNESKITVTVPSGKTIKKIDFNQGTTDWASGKMSANSGSINDTNKIWTASEDVVEVVLTITGTFKFTKIVVTVAE